MASDNGQTCNRWSLFTFIRLTTAELVIRPLTTRQHHVVLQKVISVCEHDGFAARVRALRSEHELLYRSLPAPTRDMNVKPRYRQRI
jgi:hypothetical protein